VLATTVTDQSEHSALDFLIVE